jgi:ankyrin repeat protein
VNARTAGDDAQTPLHLAATMGKMKAVQALVSAGADLTLKDSKGRTPYDAAQRAGLTEVAAYLNAAR